MDAMELLTLLFGVDKAQTDTYPFTIPEDQTMGLRAWVDWLNNASYRHCTGRDDPTLDPYADVMFETALRSTVPEERAALEALGTFTYTQMAQLAPSIEKKLRVVNTLAMQVMSRVVKEES